MSSLSVNHPAVIFISAVLTDAIIGDPYYRLHPVRLIGNLARFYEARFFKRKMIQKQHGLLFLISVISSVAIIWMAIRFVFALLHPSAAAIFDIFILYSTFALKDLGFHARRVRESVQQDDLQNAREAVRFLVGRDVTVLDLNGVTRATIESVAESVVDSLMAPLFWYLIGSAFLFYPMHSQIPVGVLLALVYRVTNTLDSMVGYKNERYRTFGAASARFDDLLNFIPARLSVVYLFLGSALCLLGQRTDRLSPLQGLNVFISDRKKSPSPNSAHSESFVAGALQVALGGPTIYPHGTVDKPWMGHLGSRHVTAHHLKQTWHLIVTSSALFFLIGVIFLTGIF